VTDIDEPTPPVDGRVARRQRNIDAVLDVVVDMFTEEAMFPTIEQVATRSGLSLRSLYRYFADPGELLEAAIARTSRRGRALARLPAEGEGPFARRVDDFVSMRLRLHDAVGAAQRATLANAARHPQIRTQLALDRDDMRAQLEAQFAPEISLHKGAHREAVVAAADLLTQLESIDFLRRHRRLSVEETHAVLVGGLRALLD
jgi:AcrR family transcriptional regulator